jgi:hypothetical protein
LEKSGVFIGPQRELKMMTLRKKIMENGRRIKEVGIFLSLLFSFSCFLGNEISQYIAFKDGNK